jgi:hypothetical protein
MEKHEKVMGIESYRRLQIVLAISVTMSSCSQKEINQYELCEEFYELNKGKDFDGIYDVSIGVRRTSAEYDESSNQNHLIFNSIEVFDAESKKDITIPVFKMGASLAEQDSIFRKIKPEVKEFLVRKLGDPVDSVLFDSYIRYISDVYQKYYDITAPTNNNYKNIVVESHPRTGKFITFILNDRAKVYYVADSTTLNEYWSKRFNTLKRLDKDWYCEVTEESKTN